MTKTSIRQSKNWRNFPFSNKSVSNISIKVQIVLPRSRNTPFYFYKFKLKIQKVKNWTTAHLFLSTLYTISKTASTNWKIQLQLFLDFSLRRKCKILNFHSWFQNQFRDWSFQAHFLKKKKNGGIVQNQLVFLFHFGWDSLTFVDTQFKCHKNKFD